MKKNRCGKKASAVLSVENEKGVEGRTVPAKNDNLACCVLHPPICGMLSLELISEIHPKSNLNFALLKKMLILIFLCKTGRERGAGQAQRGDMCWEGWLVEEVFREVLEQLQRPLHSTGPN